MNLPKEGGGMDSRLEMLNQAIKSNGEQLTRLEGEFKENKLLTLEEIKDMKKEINQLSIRQTATEGNVNQIFGMLSKIDLSVSGLTDNLRKDKDEQLQNFKAFTWKLAGGLSLAYLIFELGIK